MIKTVIQVAEIGIGLTVALFIGGEILKLLDGGVVSYFNPVLENFIQLFGFVNTDIFATIICGIFIVMGGRWIMSWASNNGGHTPNNKGN